MLIVTNTAAVTLAPGQALTFNDVIWKSGCAESFRGNGSFVSAGRGVFELSFEGNISGATAATPIQLNLEINGSPLPETTIIETPETADVFNSISRSTIIGNQGDCCNPNPGNVSITVVNTGTSTLTVGANAKLSVKRIG